MMADKKTRLSPLGVETLPYRRKVSLFAMRPIRKFGGGEGYAIFRRGNPNVVLGVYDTWADAARLVAIENRMLQSAT